VERSYAGVLGCLAFATVVGRGLLHSSGLEATVGAAVAWMAAFGAIGFVVGRLARSIVEESVRSRMAEELSARAEASRNDASPAVAR
jgi:hypothetical protein